jgi:hypothetical protein
MSTATNDEVRRQWFHCSWSLMTCNERNSCAKHKCKRASIAERLVLWASCDSPQAHPPLPFRTHVVSEAGLRLPISSCAWCQMHASKPVQREAEATLKKVGRTQASGSAAVGSWRKGARPPLSTCAFTCSPHAKPSYGAAACGASTTSWLQQALRPR